MASLPRNCPDCGVRLKGELPRKNGKVRCPECGAAIGGKQEADEADDGIQSKHGSVPAAAKRERRYHDDEVARPVRKKQASSGSALVLVGIILAGMVLLLLGAGAAGIYWYTGRSTPVVVQAPPPEAAERIHVANPEAGPEKKPAQANPLEKVPEDVPARPQQPQEPPKEPIKPIPTPDRGGPAPALGEFPLEKLKEASVYIKMRSGQTGATGSGFVIRSQGDTAYVVTNHHVVTPKAEASDPIRPGRIPRPPVVTRPTVEWTVVFRSGTEEEQSVRAQLVGDDKLADLAILKVTGVKNAPQPIEYAQSPKLVETMSVRAFGFPFGEDLDPMKKNPSITVTSGDVSSLRMDRGTLVEVQLNLDLNPGNSGGPVVDGKGVLVGVAVAKVVNSRIGFAVPVHKLNSLLEGRVEVPYSLQILTVNGQTQLRVLAHAADPLNQLRSATLLYGTPDEVKNPVHGKNGWERMSGAKSAEMKIHGATALAMVPIAPPNGEIKLVLQSAFQNAAGETIYTEARTMSLGGQAPVPPVNPGDANKPPVVNAPPVTGPATGGELTKLLADLKSMDESARQRAAEAIKQFPPAERRDEVKQALEGLFTATEPATRSAGARAFAACDPKESAPVLAKLLEDTTPAVRQAVLQILKDRKDPRVATAVATRLSVDGPAAVDVLKLLGPAGEKAALPFLKDTNPFARLWAFQVIKEIGGPDSVPVLEEIMAANNTDAAQARPALAAIRERLPLTKEEWPKILEDLKSPDGPVRAAAARRIATTPPVEERRADILVRLEALLNDQDAGARIAAVKGLGRWGGKATVPLLLKRLEAGDRSLHGPAMEVLAESKDEAAAAAIAKRVGDIFDRAEATKALKAMDQPLAEKALLSLFTDTNAFLRAEACKLLAELGGRDSIAPLEQLVAEKNIFYSGPADAALTAIKSRANTEKK